MHDRWPTIATVYASTHQALEHFTILFHEPLYSTIDDILREEKLIILRDFNAHVEKTMKLEMQ